MEVLSTPQMSEGDSPLWRTDEVDEMVVHRRPAGFIRRVIATVIDTIIIGLLFQFFMFAGMAGLSAAGLSAVSAFDFSGLGSISLGSLFFIQIGYFGFFHTHCGQTPGKMTLRIIVVSDTTDAFGRPSPSQAVFRALGLFISASFFGLGFLITLFGRKKRALHDYLCGTQVLLAP